MCTCSWGAVATSAGPAVLPEILVPKALCACRPSNCAFMADAFSGINGLAEYFASVNRPFCKKDLTLMNAK